MHIIPVAQPLFRLSANLPLFTLGVPFRDESVAIEVVTEVFRNEPRFRQDQRFGRVGILDPDDGGLSEWVHLLELLGAEHVGASLEGFEIIVDAEFFEEPEDALGSGFLQPGWSVPGLCVSWRRTYQ